MQNKITFEAKEVKSQEMKSHLSRCLNNGMCWPKHVCLKGNIEQWAVCAGTAKVIEEHFEGEHNFIRKAAGSIYTNILLLVLPQ